MKKRIPILIVLVLVVVAAVWMLRRGNGKGGPLVLYGNVDIREVSLGFRVAGKVSELLVDEGDHVKAGDTIAKLDDEPYRNLVASAKAQVDSLKAKLQLRETGNRPQEIAEARAAVAEREAVYANAQLLFKRQQELIDSGTKAATLQDRDNALAAFHQSEAQLNSAREALKLEEEGFRKEDIEQTRADLSQAQAELATDELQAKDTV